MTPRGEALKDRRRTSPPRVANRLERAFRNDEREKLTRVHIPASLLAVSTMITLCSTVVTEAAAATPTPP